MADLARQVGGDAVEVIDVMGLGENPHTFDLRPGDLARIHSARVVIASGKGLEDGFMDKVGHTLAPEAILVEAGRKVPSCVVDDGNEVFVCCPHHATGAVDPHWWHSVKGMQRAVRSVADAFAEADPANEALYKRNAATYSKHLDELDEWVRREVAVIPRSRRYLTTAHAAFGYFCRDYGFKSVPVQGLNKEQDPSPEYLAETIGILRKERIPAVFPEAQANPKVLQSMVAETGTRGGQIFARRHAHR